MVKLRRVICALRNIKQLVKMRSLAVIDYIENMIRAPVIAAIR